MKKALSGVLAASLALSSFASVAFAAEATAPKTAQEMFDALKAKGIFDGYEDGSAGLDKSMTRAEVTKVLVKLLGLTENKAGASVYTDLDGAGWAEGFIGAATKAGIMDGVADGKFDPSGKFTTEQLAAVLVRALKLPLSTEAAEGVVADWAKAYVATAVKAGLIEKTADYTTPALRSVLVASSFVADAKITEANKPVQAVEAKIVGAKKIEVTFAAAVDTAKAKITVSKGAVSTNLDKVTFADDKKSATVEVTTKLSKGDYTVKVSGVTEADVTKTVTAEDEKVAKINVLTQTAPLNLGTVTINAVNYTANDTAFVSYEVKNQYGEKLSNQQITWTQSTGGQIADDAVNGKLTIGNTASAGVDFIPGNKVFITGVHTASGTVVNGQVEIGLASKADAVTFKGVYNNVTNKVEALPAGFAANKYELLFEVIDQYGNKIAAPALTDLAYTSNNPLFVAAPSEVDATTRTIDDVVYQAIKLAPGTNVNGGGTATIQLISKITGKSSTHTVTADAKAAVKTFTISAPEKLVAETEKVEIPFSAVDQYGNAITSFDDLNTKVTFAAGLALEKQSNGSAKLFFTAPATGATEAADLPVYLTSLVSNGGNFSSLMVNVKDLAVPTTIVGVDSDVATTLARGGVVDIAPKNLIIQDQYGRTMSDATIETWVGAAGGNNRIVVATDTAAASTVTVTSDVTVADNANVVLDDKDDSFTITAQAGTGTVNASETLTFALSTAATATAIPASAKSVVIKLAEQSEFKSYVADDLGTVYNNAIAGTDTASAYDRTVKVYGVKEDGTKVVLPAAFYTVTTDGKLDVTANVISDKATLGYVATDFEDATTNKPYADVKVNVLVTVNDANGAAAAIIEKELLVSNKTPKVTAVGLNGDNVKDGSAFIVSGAISNATLTGASYIVAGDLKDQYGVVIVEAPVVTITNLVKVDGSALAVVSNGTTTTNITGAAAGDKFTATYKYASGKTVSINFTVQAN